jgi:hypothetical protein
LSSTHVDQQGNAITLELVVELANEEIGGIIVATQNCTNSTSLVTETVIHLALSKPFSELTQAEILDIENGCLEKYTQFEFVGLWTQFDLGCGLHL